MSPPAQPHDSSRTLTVPTALTARQQLITLYQAAVAGAQPEAATDAAIPSLDLSPTGRLWLIALGKAAPRMTAGALVGLRARDVELAGGVVVAPNTGQSLHARLTSVGGDHPIPGTRSVRAAEALGDIVAGVGAGDDVIVLVSGGGSSLIAAAAPDVPEFTSDDVTALYAALMASGIDIRIMNAVRRRFTRWGGGRLAVALARAGARVHCLVVSDVPGDDAAVVSSGPCAPDPLTAGALIAALRQTAAWTGMPERARAHLTAVERGSAPETPKPDDPAFQAVATQVILANGHALRAAADAARALGINEVTISRESLAGEAAIFGVRLASELIARVARARRTGGTTAAGGAGGGRISRCIIWGGETTVAGLDTDDVRAGASQGDGDNGVPQRAIAPGRAQGGRNQELALAAARSLSDAGDRAAGIALLAAGTDGRDGPTDAAGAVVDSVTWTTITAAGRDPEVDLARHDAYRALDAAGALLRTGLTGTNVMDVVIGLAL